ncbi:MAG: L,D-transpeptidase [Planctomycetota bacterium]|jgi:lipoprotein-anchoring transpeptidase ErfK/SrfK
MNRRTRLVLGWIAAGAVVALIVVVIIAFSGGGAPPEEAGPAKGSPPGRVQPDSAPGPVEPDDEAAGDGQGPSEAENEAPEPAPGVPELNREIHQVRAGQLFREGMQLAEAAAKGASDKYVKARNALSAAVFSGKLKAGEAEKARRELWKIAQTTILSPRVYPGDPYTFAYEFKSGETLADQRRKGKTSPGVVTANDLRVPAAAIELANKTPATKFQAGRKYKLIRGPFRAMVYRSQFAMDIYLQREGCPKTFIRRLRVGLGKNGSTPLGSWIVKIKDVGATWYPPPASGLTGPIGPWDDDYAFGKKGLWIGIAGLDEANRDARGYGIHSTDDPSSVGKESSLGCIRLRDGDIDFVFSVLYEDNSTVHVLR